MFKKARIFAQEAHAGQTRWNGEAYFDAHIAKVARYVEENYFTLFPDSVNNMSIFKDPILCAAYLHDTVEDTGVTLAEIETEFSPMVAKLVDALTKRPGEAYYDFIMRINRAGPMARGIKIADIRCNMADADEKEKKSARYAKYQLSEHILVESQKQES